MQGIKDICFSSYDVTKIKKKPIISVVEQMISLWCSNACFRYELLSHSHQKLSCLNAILPGLLKTPWAWGGGADFAPFLIRLFLIVEA